MLHSALRLSPRGSAALTLAEVLISAAVGSVIMFVLVSSSIAMQRSLSATDHYIVSSNNAGRLIDYVGQDLRRALRVGRITGGTSTTIKNNASFAVSEANVLTINVPDWYRANLPDNAAGSTFKTSRYPREDLDSLATFNSNPAGSPLNGCIPWAEAVAVSGLKQTIRFAPGGVGTGEMQVRYSRGPRSATDPRMCYFRTEYPVGSETPFAEPRDIAGQLAVGDAIPNLVITAANLPASNPAYGRTFTLASSFTPRFRRAGSSSAETAQFAHLLVRSGRRD